MARLRLPGEWQQCAFRFLTSIYDLSGSDQSLYGYHGILCQFFASGLDPDSVTKTAIESYINRASVGRGREGRPIKPATRNHRLTVICSFYKFASTYIVDGVPLYRKALPTLGIPYSQPDIDYKAIEVDDFEKLIKSLPDTPAGWRDKALYLFFAFTGRRRSEVVFLQWRDIASAMIVDEDGTRRPGHVFTYIGKGHSRQPKTKELPASAYAALIWYLEKSGRLATMQPDSALFAPTKQTHPYTDGSKRKFLNSDYVNLAFKMHCEQAGLDATHLSLHSLRHLSAKLRYALGSDVRSIQNLLDHSSLATTDRYLRALAGTADKDSVLLDRRLGHLIKL